MNAAGDPTSPAAEDATSAAAGAPVAGAAGRRLAGERLRQAILAGDMAPGHRLVEEELAGMLGVTRASLRAALFDLTADGLVERIPNRGARVRAITIDEAIAITECRIALEGLCAAKAAETGSPSPRPRGCGSWARNSSAASRTASCSSTRRSTTSCTGWYGISPDRRCAAALLERLNGQLVRHQFQLSLRPGRAAGVAARAPGDHCRDRRTAPRRGRGGHPPPPAQRHHGAARSAQVGQPKLGQPKLGQPKLGQPKLGQHEEEAR